MTLPGHYLGGLTTYAAHLPWDMEYSIELDENGHYRLFSRDTEDRKSPSEPVQIGRAHV